FQSIAEPADAFNHIGGLAEFLAKASDMRVHRARINNTFVTPYVVKQAVTPLNATASLDQRAQKFEFKTCEIDSLPVNRNLITRRINGNRTSRQAFVVLFRLATSHDRSNPQHHFPRTERLCHVIVRAKLQTDYPVDFLGFRRQHHDRDSASPWV